MPRIDFAAVLQFVLAIGDNDFARRQPCRNARGVPVGIGDGDRVNLYRSVLGDHKYIDSLGTAQDCGRRNQHNILQRIDKQMHVHKLVRE